jgi:tryptophan-rich sensory protein
LNTSWSFAFFGAHSPALGLMVILSLESLIVLTIFLFRRLDRVAAACLLPYAVWVAFATYLNVGFWMLN